jgi:hypothetical protein
MRKNQLKKSWHPLQQRQTGRFRLKASAIYGVSKEIYASRDAIHELYLIKAKSHRGYLSSGTFVSCPQCRLMDSPYPVSRTKLREHLITHKLMKSLGTEQEWVLELRTAMLNRVALMTSKNPRNNLPT